METISVWLVESRDEDGYMFVPIPSLLPVSLAIASWSPEMLQHFMRTHWIQSRVWGKEKLCTCDHFNADSQMKCSLNGLCTVVTRRIKQRKKSYKFPWTTFTFNITIWYFLFIEMWQHSQRRCPIKKQVRYVSPDMPIQGTLGHVLRICRL